MFYGLADSNNIIQTLVVLSNIMDVAVVADGLEKSIIANKNPLCMGKHRGYKDYYWDCISYSQFS